MKISDIKYLASFIIPVLIFVGLKYESFFSYSAVLFAFLVVPTLEPIFKSSTYNLNEEEKANKLTSHFFDLILFLNIPLIYISLYWLGVKISSCHLSSFETVGYVLSFGTFLGASGINVAHELGHKDHIFSKVSAVLLLIPSLYTHFIIEHNRGHHKNVATPKDPATARKNELLYTFWIRSIVGSYINAWKLEFKRLDKSNLPGWHFSNLMFLFLGIQFLYLFVLWLLFGFMTMIILITIAALSFVFLETINYVEHYGLMRKQLPSGRYERVMPKHSWNSNHYLGRIILYELTRHSDHHYLANKKYQVLDHHNESPQLPFGYPISMLVSLCPPLWFRIMNSKLESID